MEKQRKIVLLERYSYNQRKKLSLTDDQINLLKWLLEDAGGWMDTDEITCTVIDDEIPPIII